MSGLIRARARRTSFVLAALLSAVAVAPMVAYASDLYRGSVSAPRHAVTASVPAGTYWLGGITSQGDPVAAAVMHRATSVDARIALDAMCTSGPNVFLDRTFPLPVKPTGAIPGYNITIPPDPKHGILGGFDKFSGQMNKARTRLSGRWQIHIVFQNNDGSTDTCDSGAVSFTAS